MLNVLRLAASITTDRWCTQQAFDYSIQWSPAEQWQFWNSFFGLILMVITFFLYIFGLLDPVIPLKSLDIYWNQPVNEYLLQINRNFLDWEELPIGWSWLKLIWYGDFLNFLPIAILSGITIFCYIVILPNMLVRKDYWMAMIAFLEILILCLAASGILTVGH